jgi:hypothetical protein
VGVDGTRGALFALGVYVGVTETFAGVQSTANSYTSLWRSDTPATTLGAKRPRRSGLCLRLLRPLALPAVMDWQPLGVAVTTCVLQVSGRFSRLRLILQYSCLSAMSAPRSLTPPHACCTACLHACALHRCLPSPDAACAIERPPTSSPMLACLGSVLTPSACLPHRPRRRV